MKYLLRLRSSWATKVNKHVLMIRLTMEYYFRICQLGTVQTYAFTLWLWTLNPLCISLFYNSCSKSKTAKQQISYAFEFFDSNTGSTAVACAFVAALNSLKNQFCLGKAASDALTEISTSQNHVDTQSKWLKTMSVPQKWLLLKKLQISLTQENQSSSQRRRSASEFTQPNQQDTQNRSEHSKW